MLYLNSWGTSFGMGLERLWAEANLQLNLINIYGPYNERASFWDSVRASQFLKKENVVLGGDLNFTMGIHEIWGPNARMDPLAAFFKNLVQNLKLVDLDP